MMNRMIAAIIMRAKARKIGPIVKPAIRVATTEDPQITMESRRIMYELIAAKKI